MNKITLNTQDIERITRIAQENNIDFFTLIHDNGANGIGYTLEMEFTIDLHGRMANVRVPVVGVEDW
jgi:hypothetical protein